MVFKSLSRIAQDDESMCREGGDNWQIERELNGVHRKNLIYFDILLQLECLLGTWI